MPLRITVELVPGGDESRARVLGRARVVQVDQHAGSFRSYSVEIQEAQPLLTRRRRTWRGTVKKHDRDLSVWLLIGKAIRAALRSEPEETT